MKKNLRSAKVITIFFSALSMLGFVAVLKNGLNGQTGLLIGAIAGVLGIVGAIKLHKVVVISALGLALIKAVMNVPHALQAYSGNTASIMGSIFGSLLFPIVLMLFYRALKKSDA